ncbi:MAG: hypothetical protein JWM57_2702 [Phycisphaerales bacterium]|nr:hypothetical protein [Phycisphaerales bacterium]
MIHFVCICGEPFDVPAELAGESMQCPVCMRLVDVPRLSDEGSFEDDGTVRMGNSHQTPSGLGDKFRAFGQHSDMRPDLEDFLLAGTGDPATTPKARPTPRYDPITGELLLPVEILNDDLPPPPVINTGAPVLGYARTVPRAGDRESRVTLHWWAVPWRLLGGWSLMAISIIWGVHVFCTVGVMIPGFNVFFILPAFVITLILIAHYVNTIEEFGPNDRDSVPVLLRSVSLGEDVFHPLFRCLMSGLYAFFPLLVIAIFSPPHAFRDHWWLWLAPLGWGLLLFPAAIFTTVCGGVLHNLMPQRLLSVVIAAPVRYALASLVFYVALVGYGVAISSIEISPPTALVPSATTGQLLQTVKNTSITVGIFAADVYLMHLAAAWLGLIYRSKHEQFNWVLQRHERVYRDDVMAKLMNRRGKGHLADQQRLRESGARPGLPPPRQHSGFEVKL